MNSKTYVSDPKIWQTFYQNMAEKKFNPYKYRPKQKGRGWSYKNSYRIPLRPHSEINVQKNVPLVTPVAAIEERVKEEYKKDVMDGNPHVTPRKGIKRKGEQMRATNIKKSKRTTTQTNSAKEGLQKKPVKDTYLRQLDKNRTKKSDRKFLDIDQYRNIFT